MAVKKNTIMCRFIQIAERPKGGYVFDNRRPLGKKTYGFFVTPKQRQKLDIGSVVIIDNENQYIPHAAVIIDNVTERNSQAKHNVIAKNTGHHLRGYIKANYHSSKYANKAYAVFKDVAHEARARVSMEQRELKR